jgi:biotin-[acetyl-CoA-carboxylase] ligase BirA-like protein
MDVAKTELLSLDWGWVSARQQTQGRGTHGRPWYSPPGNLYMTLGIRLACFSRERLGTLSLEAGWVLWNCLQERLTGGDSPAFWLKWPNDLLRDQEKVAGFLLEVHQSHVLIGLGVNLDAPPDVQDGGRPAGSLQSPLERPWDRLALGQEFSNRLVERLLKPWDASAKRELFESWSAATRWKVPLSLRPKNSEKDSEQAPVWVQPLTLTDLGHLTVQHEDGRLETLVADYLW